ncbi:MAG: hypothetical protein KJZ70_02410 [Bryobacterales bacterium]|nr:hypothetical protein [Bryobacterales bacterium]
MNWRVWMTNNHWPEWGGYTAIAIAMALIAWLNWIGGGLFASFYGILVTLVALRYGWLGGLLAAILSAVLLLIGETPALETAVDAGSLITVGVSVGLLTAREQRRKRHYKNLAEKLGNVYEKVQANFEGMKRAERLSALGQLSAGLAHEIRNPLASISGAAAILRRSQGLEPKQAKCIDIIASECNRLDGLLTNFLNFARPRPPRFQKVDLLPVLENVLALAGHGIRGKQVNLANRMEVGLPSVECDPEQLEQVLLNLMINAIEASPDGDMVELGAAYSGDKITIDVVDHGHGVAAAHVDRLFDPFFTTKEHGTGLGLPVAHQIMTQMGGSLLARKNSGPGMTFRVVLPSKQTGS